METEMAWISPPSPQGDYKIVATEFDAIEISTEVQKQHSHGVDLTAIFPLILNDAEIIRTRDRHISERRKKVSFEVVLWQMMQLDQLISIKL